MKTSRSRIAGLLIAASALTSVSVQAAVSEQQFAQMQAQMMALSQRLAALEAENSRLKQDSEQVVRDIAVTRERVASVRESKAAASWTDSIKLKGDMRLRYESIDVENKKRRERNRLRARAAIIAKVDDVELGLGFASGGDDPTSTNQTLGKGGSTKDMRLDLAYFNWSATDNLNIIGGKFKNVWYKPQKHGLIWDGDFNPEGVAVTWSSDSFFASAGGMWLESDSKAANTDYSWGAQAGFKGKLGAAKLVAGVGYYDLGTAGKSSFFGDDDDFYGNSFACVDPVSLAGCVYLNDYKEIEVFADASMHIGDMPVSVFADYVTNDDVSQDDTGYAVGLKLGAAKAAGSWQAAYIYQDLEADAVLGLLSDSDFGGGDTGAKGHVFKAGYAVSKKWTLGVTYLVNEVGDSETDYKRIQVDTKFKY